MKNLFPLVCFAAALGSASIAVAGTSTLANVQTAFAGESNAANKYSQFAEKADSEGYPQVAKLFRAASKAEQIHRERHRDVIRKLGGEGADATLDEVKVGTTEENLKAAVAGESYERDTMYPGFIATAKAEDARDAVRSLQGALSAEREHAKLFQAALEQLGDNPAADYYVCPTCGYTMATRPEEPCVVCRTKADKFISIE